MTKEIDNPPFRSKHFNMNLILTCNIHEGQIADHYMSGKLPTYPSPKPTLSSKQRAKKVLSDNPGLVDFAIGLVNSVFNLPNRLVMFFEEFEQQKNCEINSASQNVLGAS